MTHDLRLRDLRTARADLERAIAELRARSWSIGEAEVALLSVVERLEACAPRGDGPNDLQDFVLEKIGRLLGDLRVVMAARERIDAGTNLAD